MKKIQLSLFIPVYNEEKIIKKNIELIKDTLEELEISYEIIIIDDNSTDKTAEIAENLENSSKNIKHIRYNNGPSRRENLAKSFIKATSEIIMFMDADLSTDLKFIKPVFEAINSEKYDISIGSRHLKGSKVKRKKDRFFISHAFKFIVKTMFLSYINDHECGFKAFKKDKMIYLIKKYLGYDSAYRRKMFWDSEMLLWAQREKYRIKEIPVSWKEGDKSALHWKKELSVIPYMINFFFRYHFIRK